MYKGFQVLFWQTGQCLMRSRQDHAQALLSKYEEALTFTEDSAEQCKQHFKVLLSLVDMPSFQEAVLEIADVLESITVDYDRRCLRHGTTHLFNLFKIKLLDY